MYLAYELSNWKLKRKQKSAIISAQSIAMWYYNKHIDFNKIRQTKKQFSFTKKKKRLPFISTFEITEHLAESIHITISDCQSLATFMVPNEYGNCSQIQLSHISFLDLLIYQRVYATFGCQFGIIYDERKTREKTIWRWYIIIRECWLIYSLISKTQCFFFLSFPLLGRNTPNWEIWHFWTFYFFFCLFNTFIKFDFE